MLSTCRARSIWQVSAIGHEGHLMSYWLNSERDGQSRIDGQ